MGRFGRNERWQCKAGSSILGLDRHIGDHLVLDISPHLGLAVRPTTGAGMTVRQIRVALILITLAMLVGAFVARPQGWSIGLAGVSGAIAAYATIMIVTLALAFSKTVKEVGDSGGAGVTFGRVMGLLLAYPLYRGALVFIPLSLTFYYLNQASPGTFFNVPASEDNPFSFMQRTAEALLLQLFPDAARWHPSQIAVAEGSPWSPWITVATMGAPIAALVEVVRAWAITIVVIAVQALRGVRRPKARGASAPKVSDDIPARPMGGGDALGSVSRHEQRGARL